MSVVGVVMKRRVWERGRTTGVSGSESVVIEGSKRLLVVAGSVLAVAGNESAVAGSEPTVAGNEPALMKIFGLAGGSGEASAVMLVESGSVGLSGMEGVVVGVNRMEGVVVGMGGMEGVVVGRSGLESGAMGVKRAEGLMVRGKMTRKRKKSGALVVGW